MLIRSEVLCHLWCAGGDSHCWEVQTNPSRAAGSAANECPEGGQAGGTGCYLLWATSQAVDEPFPSAEEFVWKLPGGFKMPVNKKL